MIIDIKVGETYLLPVTVTVIEKSGWLDVVTTRDWEYRLAPSEVETLLQPVIKNIEPTPKHDPCRLFKKGDMVRVVECKGRNYSNVETGKEGIVSRNETGADMGIEVTFGDDDFWDICPSFLELVTPVEELEPYSVHESEVVDVFDIVREKLCVMTFPYGAKEEGYYLNKLAAKEAAEAERDRLNAEWRKEQE